MTGPGPKKNPKTIPSGVSLSSLDWPLGGIGLVVGATWQPEKDIHATPRA